jgi:hypothetical protein
VEDCRLPPPCYLPLPIYYFHFMIELLIRVAAAAMTCAAIYLIVQLISLIQEQQRKGSRSAARRLKQLRNNQRLVVDPPRRPYQAPARPTAEPTTYSRSIPTPPAYATRYQRGEVETRLLTLLGGQRATAIRLLSSIQSRYPDRDQQWCLEKALRDLERDRR